MAIATLPIATHLKAIARSLDDVRGLARHAPSQKLVLERLAQAKQSLEEIELAVSQSAES